VKNRSSASVRETANDLQGLLRSGPVLVYERRVGCSKDATQDKGDNDSVVKLSRYRDEVGHQIEWRGQVCDHQSQQRLSRPRHARISDQTPEKDDAVWDESGQRAGVGPAAGRNQCEHRRRVDDQETRSHDQCPLKERHTRERSRKALVCSVLTSGTRRR
jgi:hypothetical protein